jgi:subtilisin family serine protease
MKVPLSLLLLFCLPVVQLHAKEVESRVVVAPSVRFLKSVAEAPPFWVAPGIVDAKGFVGSLRFSTPLTASEIAAIEALKVKFKRQSSDREPWDVDHIGSIYPARIPWQTLDQLLGTKKLVQVESENVLKPHQPLNVTVPQTGSPEFIDAMQKATDLRPGEGIRIADIDSGIDVFHPSFFHADGGYYDWFDLDEDGQLTFGTDGCDLNRDGQISADEVIEYHDVTLVNMYDWAGINLKELKEELQPDGAFDFGVDWIYLDTNGNGERDFGPEGGFDDSAPAFGEPVLVVDDVNRNGQIDPLERFVLLRSSKIKKAYALGKEFVAGENLTELTSDVFPAESDGTPVSMHGTGVAGILVANTPGMNKYVGVAPFADLYMIDSSSDGGQGGGVDGTISKLVWAKEQQVDIVLFEFSSWGMTFMDGTSNLEKAIDQLYEKNGIMQVVPAGNLADSGKHMQTELAPGKADLGIVLPENWDGYEFYPFETPVLIFSIYYEGNTTDLDLEVKVPELGAYVPIATNVYQPMNLGGGMQLVSYAEKSLAGITHRMLYIMDSEQKAVKTGTWNWRLNNTTGGKLVVHGYINDFVSSWGRAIEFDKWESTATTICHPSTADSAMSVAAYGGEHGTAEELGRVRDYSSRGPRMDGFQAIDIAAPDDPYTPLARMKTGMMMGLLDIQAGYTVFGGTSGAGPHVAAALALLMQMEPDLSPSKLFDRLVKYSSQEPFMGATPNAEYGYGKLNVYKSQFSLMPPGNNPPTASLSLTFRNGFYATFDATKSKDPEAGPLQYRWDFDYDGEWETDWIDQGKVEFGYVEVGTYTAKVAVRDDPGAVAEALVQIEVLDDYQPGKKPLDPVDDVLTQSDVTGDFDVHTPFLVEPAEKGDGKKGGGCTATSTPTSGGALLGFLLLLACALRVRRARQRP